MRNYPKSKSWQDFKGKNKEERREMAVAAWLEARREAGYDVDKNWESEDEKD